MPTSSRKPEPCLFVLDVGHGNAAVLHDEGGTVVFDTGRGAHVARHLAEMKVKCIQAMLLSHADADHIGGAVTLLMNQALKIDEVMLNADASKGSAVFEQLCLALVEANERAGTRIDGRLATSTRLKRKGASIEILHPPDAAVLSGVGGRSKSGQRHTSNSLSAAIRVSHSVASSVLLAGDIEFDCLDGWKERAVSPTASVLIFPHHGGLPGTIDEKEAALFGFELTRMVAPEVVIFSNHRTKFDNPREVVLAGISKVNPHTRFACTQLPERLHQLVETDECWSLHKPAGRRGVIEGSICLEFHKAGVRVYFGEAP